MASNDKIKEVNSKIKANDERRISLRAELKDAFIANSEENFLNLLNVLDDHELLHLERGYLFTENPMLAWYAISHCLSAPEGRYLGYLFWYDDLSKALNETNLDFPTTEEAEKEWYLEKVKLHRKTLPIPDWCSAYLLKCSHSVEELFVDANSPKTFLAKLPESFGFSKRGWSAYAEEQKTARDQNIYYMYTSLLADNYTKRAAIEAIMEEHDFKDERSVEKIISKMARAVPKSIP